MASRFVPPNATAQAAIILDRPAPPGGVVVALESLNPAVCDVPASVTLLEGWIGATFEISFVAAGVTQVKATLSGVEKLLDVTCGGPVVGVRPSTRIVLVSLEPEPIVAGASDPRPDAEVAVSLEPTAVSGGDVAAGESSPRPKVGKTLRPKPYFAGE